MTEDDTVFTLPEAAIYAHVDRNTLYIAMRSGQLKASKQGHYWRIKKSDLEQYRKSKYDPAKRKLNGELIFNIDKGSYSAHYVAAVIAEDLGISYDVQKIYYLIRVGKIKAKRMGRLWVIDREDALALQESVREQHFGKGNRKLG